MAEITEREFQCRISIRLEDEDDICEKLRKALPALTWQTGDSSWDKIRVWGQTADVFVRVYRYEEPGPFLLTVRLQTPGGGSAESEYHALRDIVLVALEATVQKTLEPQAVSLIKVDGQFPAEYEFESDLSLRQMDSLLDRTDFSLPAGKHYWQWTWQGSPNPNLERGIYRWDGKERIRITGDAPAYKLEIGRWTDVADRLPTCDQVHEALQTTILPALGARNVRACPR